jgi:type III secretory pathway lipoprotein EscJ
MSVLRSLIVCGLAALLVSGCGSTPVADDVGQREANEIVALLRQQGIPSQLSKARGSKARYTVLVPTSQFADAAGFLSKLGLPGDKKASFQELTASNGIIPPSREVEALRLDRATAAELEDLLRTRPEVAAVSVLVRVRSVEAGANPSAMVVIQERDGTTINPSEITEIASRAVPGIKRDDVLVSLSRSGRQSGDQAGETLTQLVPFLGAWRVPASEYQSLVFLFIALSLFVGGLSGLTGYLVGQFNWINRQASSGAPRGSRGVGARGVDTARERVGEQEDGGV